MIAFKKRTIYSLLTKLKSRKSNFLSTKTQYIDNYTKTHHHHSIFKQTPHSSKTLSKLLQKTNWKVAEINAKILNIFKLKMNIKKQTNLNTQPIEVNLNFRTFKPQNYPKEEKTFKKNCQEDCHSDYASHLCTKAETKLCSSTSTFSFNV